MGHELASRVEVTGQRPSSSGLGSFTGERLHAGDSLFAVDLARHQAAYRFALERVGRGRVLDLGSGSGHGTGKLGARGIRVVGLDRVSPDRQYLGASACFIRGDITTPPLRDRSFDWVLSFQVIEHLEDPLSHLRAVARLLRHDGRALVTTPNRLTSDGVNPFHVREYSAGELAALASGVFEQVDMLGVGASARVRGYQAARARRIASIVRLDPLGLRHRLPAPWVHWLFGRFAVLVRRSVQRQGRLPQVDWRDFPIAPVDDHCLDLLAVLGRPNGQPPEPYRRMQSTGDSEPSSDRSSLA